MGTSAASAYLLDADIALGSPPRWDVTPAVDFRGRYVLRRSKKVHDDESRMVEELISTLREGDQDRLGPFLREAVRSPEWFEVDVERGRVIVAQSDGTRFSAIRDGSRESYFVSALGDMRSVQVNLTPHRLTVVQGGRAQQVISLRPVDGRSFRLEQAVLTYKLPQPLRNEAEYRRV